MCSVRLYQRQVSPLQSGHRNGLPACGGRQGVSRFETGAGAAAGILTEYSEKIWGARRKNCDERTGAHSQGKWRRNAGRKLLRAVTICWRRTKGRALKWSRMDLLWRDKWIERLLKTSQVRIKLIRGVTPLFRGRWLRSTFPVSLEKLVTPEHSKNSQERTLKIGKWTDN